MEEEQKLIVAAARKGASTACVEMFRHLDTSPRQFELFCTVTDFCDEIEMRARRPR